MVTVCIVPLRLLRWGSQSFTAEEWRAQRGQRTLIHSCSFKKQLSFPSRYWVGSAGVPSGPANADATEVDFNSKFGMDDEKLARGFAQHHRWLQCEHAVFKKIEAAAQALGFEHCAYGLRVPLPLSSPKTIILNNYPVAWRKGAGKTPGAEHEISSVGFTVANGASPRAGR